MFKGKSRPTTVSHISNFKTAVFRSVMSYCPMSVHWHSFAFRWHHFIDLQYMFDFLVPSWLCRGMHLPLYSFIFSTRVSLAFSNANKGFFCVRYLNVTDGFEAKIGSKRYDNLPVFGLIQDQT